jgi:hypothetical protein
MYMMCVELAREDRLGVRGTGVWVGVRGMGVEGTEGVCGIGVYVLGVCGG